MTLVVGAVDGPDGRVGLGLAGMEPHTKVMALFAAVHDAGSREQPERAEGTVGHASGRGGRVAVGNRRGRLLGHGLHELADLVAAFFEQPILQLVLQVAAVGPGEGPVQAGQRRGHGQLGIALHIDRHGAGKAVVRQAAREVVSDQRGEGALVIDERLDQVGE